MATRDYKNLMKEAMNIKSFSVKDFDRRMRAVRKIWYFIVPKIEGEIKLTMTQLSQYYVKKILNQTWIPSHP